MGPKSSTAQSGEYATLVQDYDIIRTVDSEGLLYLKKKSNGEDYLLREFTFNDKREYEKNL